ncbi:MAG TPA: hypothetical protein VNN07_19315 [Candidatus Tectomicrobia bacterium]|nr:hypothetical protein [Candidatus Tectomicrobia bacterium]
MEERRLDNVTEMGQRAQRRAAEMASRAGAYAQERAEEMTGRAQEMASRAGDYVQERAEAVDARLQRMTGRSVEEMTRDVRRWVENHPLQAIAMTIGVGFLLGKILTRRD